jgi:hypothetical protein
MKEREGWQEGYRNYEISLLNLPCDVDFGVVELRGWRELEKLLPERRAAE